jgi:hypothetical protein
LYIGGERAQAEKWPGPVGDQQNNEQRYADEKAFHASRVHDDGGSA